VRDLVLKAAPSSGRLRSNSTTGLIPQTIIQR